MATRLGHAVLHYIVTLELDLITIVVDFDDPLTLVRHIYLYSLS